MSNTVYVKLVTSDSQLVKEKQVKTNANGQINLKQLASEWNVQDFVWVDAEQPLQELRDGWSDISFSFATGMSKNPVMLTASGIGRHGLKTPLQPATSTGSASDTSNYVSTTTTSTTTTNSKHPKSASDKVFNDAGVSKPSFVTSMSALSNLVKNSKAREEITVTTTTTTTTQSEEEDNAAVSSKKELQTIRALWKKGILTEDEYQAKKRQLLGL